MKRSLLILFAMLTLPAFAQEEKKHIREGNKLYQSKKFTEAEKSYREALDKKKDSFKAMFNLGDAYYQQGKYQEAASQFEMLTTKKTSRDTLAKVYHNLGNSLLRQQQYDKSIAAYKNALKNDPTDEDTRYNLAYAQMMQRMQQQQQQEDKKKQDQQNKDKKENEKEKGDKNKDKKKEGDKEENKDKDKGDKKDQQQPPQQPQISKEDAQRLLDALNNDEKGVQKKLKKGQGKTKSPAEKDW